jgi:hypothetical protein
MQAALLASVITSIITGNVTLSWPIRALCLSALISVLISICIATQQTITLTRMCYDQRSVQEFRHALTKYERKARRTNAPQEGLEIRGGRQDNSSSKVSDDIEVGVRICRTEDTFDEPRKVLEPSKLQVYV